MLYFRCGLFTLLLGNPEINDFYTDLKLHGRRYENAFEKVVDNDFDMTYFIDFHLDALLHEEKLGKKYVYKIDRDHMDERLALLKRA